MRTTQCADDQVGQTRQNQHGNATHSREPSPNAAEQRCKHGSSAAAADDHDRSCYSEGQQATHQIVTHCRRLSRIAGGSGGCVGVRAMEGVSEAKLCDAQDGDEPAAAITELIV